MKINFTNMKNKFGILLLLMLAAAGGTYAQNYSALIYGKVVDSIGVPVEQVHIRVVEQPAVGTATTESGRYELTVPYDRELAEITIEISHLNYVSQRKKITITDKRLQLNFKLMPNAVLLEPATIMGEPNNDKIIETYNPKPMQWIASTKSSVENLIVLKNPSVTRNNDLTSQYNVRGGNYDENLIYLNGTEIYRPFLIRSGQQEGLSFINPDLVSGINFSAGGFDAIYGDKMSSVLDVQYKKPIRYGGSVSASLLGAAGHLEGISKDGAMSALLGVRYQSNGYVFRRMQTKGIYRPTFTDVQLLLNRHKPNSKWEFSLFGNFARNAYLFVPDSTSDMVGSLDMNEGKKYTGFFQGQEVDAFQSVFASFATKYRATDSTDIKLIFSYFNTTEKETFDIEGQYFIGDVVLSLGDTTKGEAINNRDVGGDIHHGRNFLNAHIFHGELRGEHLIKRSRLEWGIKGQSEFVDDRLSEWRLLDSAGYSLPSIPTIPGDSVAFEHPSRLISMGSSFLKVNNNLHSFRSEGFIQNRWSFGKNISKVVLVAGIRCSYWNFNNEVLITPRARLSFRPNKKTFFYFATGLYYQPAFYKEMRLEDGSLNTNIKAQKSYHVIAGSNYSFEIYRRPFKFFTEVYYKYLWDLTTYTIDNVRIIYSGKNDADGYAVGIDARLSGEFISNLESWITVSLMRTMERIDGGDYTFRPTDQRFSTSVFFQDRIPKIPMLKAHISIFYSSGIPYSSPSMRNYISHGKAYFRTDIGFSWQFVEAATYIGKRNLKPLTAGYLTFEISNLFNYSNILSFFWVAVPADNGQNMYLRVSNRLPPRLFNIKLRLEF